MSSFNKKIPKKRYAEDRRQLQRNELEKNLRADAEQELRQYFDEQKFSNDELIQAYPAIYEFIKRKHQIWLGKNMHINSSEHISKISIRAIT